MSAGFEQESAEWIAEFVGFVGLAGCKKPRFQLLCHVGSAQCPRCFKGGFGLVGLHV